jgi:hypothetical protein
MHAYTTMQKPAQQCTTIKTVVLVLHRYMRRPPKKRKTERWRRVGKASMAQGRRE